MSESGDKNYPELIILNPSHRNEIATRAYKSVSIGSIDEYSIDVLRQHGGSIRKLNIYSRDEISTSNLVELFAVLPSLKEINISSNNGYKFDAKTSALDLSRIKSLYCRSEACFVFFSSLMPDNCLEELIMNMGIFSSIARFENFIKRQPSIRAFSSTKKFPFSALSSLSLDELKLQSYINTCELIQLFKSQPNLKLFECRAELELSGFEELCNLTKLESLVIDVDEIEDGKSLEKLKNLKQLELLNGNEKFFTFQMESLERLIFHFVEPFMHNPEVLENISKNLPNLKKLNLGSTQKLNFFAKTFPALEELDMRHSELWERDSGIVNQNLKKLNLVIRTDFCIIGEVFFDLFEMFPNLEELCVHASNACEISLRNHNHLAEGNFIKELNKEVKLKAIELLSLKIDFNNLHKISHDLKIMAQKLDKVEIQFVNSIKIEDSSLESVLNELKNYFDISCFDRDEFKCIQMSKMK